MSLAEAILDYAAELETCVESMANVVVAKNLRRLVKASGKIEFPGVENLTPEQVLYNLSRTPAVPIVRPLHSPRCVPVMDDERMVYCRGGKSDGDATMIPADLALKSCRVIDGEVYVFGENGCFDYDETLTRQVLKSAENCIGGSV